MGTPAESRTVRTRRWPVINARVFRAGEELTDVPVEDLSELRSEPGTLVWVDVTGGSDEEIDQMGEEFSIHPLALEDCHHQHQRPKVDQYQQHLLLVAYGTEAAIQGEPTRLHELDLVAGENFLVPSTRSHRSTRQRSPSASKPTLSSPTPAPGFCSMSCSTS